MRSLAVGGAAATRRQIADVLAGRGHLAAEAPSPARPGAFDLVVFDASGLEPGEVPAGCDDGATSLHRRWRTLKEDGSPFALQERPGYATMRTGEPRAGVIMQVHKPDGSVAWVSVNCCPLFRPGEARPFAVVSTLSDVAEWRTLEGRLRISERMASVGRLAASVAHELNNPLTYVIANAGHLVEELPALARSLGDGPEARALGELAVNAAEATPEGAPDEHEIVVRAFEGPGGRAVVEVSDTGAGMSDQVLASLFAPFFTTKASGTGLGLSIGRGIVDSLGGEISIETRQGKGSTFRVALPAAPPDDAPAPRAPTPPPPRAAAPRPGRVLVIDDEPLIGASVRRRLGAEHEVTVEGGARPALARLERGERFDLILCDLMMPDITGMVFYDALRESRPAELDRVLFLTGGAVTARARAFLGRMAGRSVDKPVDPHSRRLVRRPVDASARRGPP